MGVTFGPFNWIERHVGGFGIFLGIADGAVPRRTAPAA